LPQELNAAYEGEMARLKRSGEVDFEIAKRALSWIYWAKRPLTMCELQEAIAVVPIKDIETYNEESRDLDPKSITDPELILDCCGSLILWDHGTDIVGFSHYTVSEFLAVKPDGNIKSELYVARACLTYLSFNVFEDGMCGIREKLLSQLRKYQLAKYITTYTGNHVSGLQAEKAVEELVLSILWSMPRRQALTELSLCYVDTLTKNIRPSMHSHQPNLPYAFYFGWKPLHYLSAWNLASTLDEICSTPPQDVIHRLNNVSQNWRTH
jgi:hypothetical protein